MLNKDDELDAEIERQYLAVRDLTDSETVQVGTNPTSGLTCPHCGTVNKRKRWTKLTPIKCTGCDKGNFRWMYGEGWVQSA